MEEKRRKPHYQHQFEVESAMKDRPLERLMIQNHALGRVLKTVGMLGLSAMIWPRVVAPYDLRVRRLVMPLKNLDPAFEGYRVVQLSDLHTGRPRVSHLVNAVRMAMDLKPDLVVITGDLLDYSKRGLEELPAVLRGLRAPDGVIAILGNHDYHEFSWRHVGERSAHRAIHKRLVALVEKLGIKLLRNKSVRVRKGGGALTIVGLDEMWVGHMDGAKAFAGVGADEAVICLQHNPDGLEFLGEYPWQWMLCGHTHGGQVDVPVLGPLYVPMKNRQWVRGLYRVGENQSMFVSTGIGYSGPPVRMRVPPEIVLFTLQCA